MVVAEDRGAVVGFAAAHHRQMGADALMRGAALYQASALALERAARSLFRAGLPLAADYEIVARAVLADRAAIDRCLRGAPAQHR